MMRIDPEEFLGKRMVVTGGTKGAGAATLRRFLAGGAEVLTAARAAPEDDALMACAVQADLSRPDGVDRFVHEIGARLGEVDVIVHMLGGSASPEAGSRLWKTVTGGRRSIST